MLRRRSLLASIASLLATPLCLTVQSATPAPSAPTRLQTDCLCAATVEFTSDCTASVVLLFSESAECSPTPACSDIGNHCKGSVWFTFAAPFQDPVFLGTKTSCRSISEVHHPCPSGIGNAKLKVTCGNCVD